MQSLVLSAVEPVFKRLMGPFALLVCVQCLLAHCEKKCAPNTTCHLSLVQTAVSISAALPLQFARKLGKSRYETLLVFVAKSATPSDLCDLI